MADWGSGCILHGDWPSCMAAPSRPRATVRDKGSSFTLTLPIVGGVAPTSPEAADQAATSRTPLRILVIDDNRDAADTLGTLLRVQGHDVRVEYDGAGGIREAQAFRPQVILLDIGLPGTNGYDVCRALRQQPWGRSALIIAMTGWGQEEDRRNSRDAGFDHHLVKPAKPQLVDSLLQDLARR